MCLISDLLVSCPTLPSQALFKWEDWQPFLQTPCNLFSAPVGQGLPGRREDCDSPNGGEPGWAAKAIPEDWFLLPRQLSALYSCLNFVGRADSSTFPVT